MNRTSPLARRTAWLGAALFAALFLLLTGLITARHGAPYTLDQDVHQWAVDHRRPAVATLFRIVTSTGTGPFPYLCAAGAGWIAGHDARSRLLAAAGALGFLVTAQAVRYSVMHATARPRPPGTDWATHATGFAFPSGHTTTSALAAGLLACALSRKIEWPCTGAPPPSWPGGPSPWVSAASTWESTGPPTSSAAGSTPSPG